MYDPYVYSYTSNFNFNFVNFEIYFKNFDCAVGFIKSDLQLKIKS